jgi:hypothetical protein
MKFVLTLMMGLIANNVSADTTFNRYDFCSVEIRKCSSSFSGGKSHCGNHGQIALINCGPGKLLKITSYLDDSTKILESKVDKALSEKGLSFVTRLNKSKIYASKKVTEQGIQKNICHAELKYKQVMSTWFTDAYLYLDGGYSIECTNPAVHDSLTLGELKSIQTPLPARKNWKEAQSNEYLYKPVSRNLMNIMKNRGYNAIFHFPLDRSEWNKRVYEEDLMMFHGGDHRSTGFIFSL